MADEDSWMHHMRRGEFAAAWAVSDDVLRQRAGVPCWHWPRHLQYVWNGAPVDGRRVLVRCYHGLGDTVQFVRLLPLLRARAAEVIVWAQPALLPLLGTADGIDRLLPLHDGAPEVAFDVDVELMELPHLLRLTEDSIPAHVPYLRAPSPVSRPRDRPDLQVGIVWRVSEWDPERSIPTAEMMRLAIPGVRLQVLQRGPAGAEWPAELGTDAGSDDVAELAATIGTLDLVISPDSFLAHLAGALAVPVWTLLPEPANWRWMIQREDTPWYPTMRLFRQARAGEWSPVITRVRDELAAWVRTKKPRTRSAA